MADKSMTDLDQLEAKINRGIARARRSMSLTLVFGLIVIIAMAVYFTILSRLVRQVAEPQAVAQYAGQQIREQLPQVRDSIVQMAQQETPGITDSLLERALNEGLPALRTRAEDHVKASVSVMLDEMQTDLVESVRQHLTSDPAVREMVTHLQTDEGQAALEEALYQSIEEALAADEKIADLVAYEETLAGVDERLHQLSVTGLENMPEDQQYLYHLVAVMRELSRRMHAEGPEMPLSPPTEPAPVEESEASPQ